MVLVPLTSLNCYMSTLHLIYFALLTPACWKYSNTNARLMTSHFLLFWTPHFEFTVQPCHLLKPNWKPSSSHSILSWHEAIIIPIPKPSKDHSEPSNFRLTSCLCKTMERMISAHLMWSLKSQGLLSKKQCGFRKNYSMLGHLVHFETFIRNTFVKKNTS